MRKEMKTWALAVLTVAALTLAGCVKEKPTELNSHEPGTPIRFGASTEWENGNETRTEYSGRDEQDRLVSSGSKYERIDWVAEKDRIRILCQAATGGTLYNGTGDDYLLGAPVESGRYSKAAIEPCAGDGLQWGTGNHIFYAFYPAVGTISNYNFTRYNPVKKEEANIEPVGNRAKITAVIPSTQEAIQESGTNNFKPNMNLAYMYAAERVSANDASGRISLTFEPLVTTLEFTLKAFSGNAITQPLTRVELMSKATPLAGTFTATLTVGSDPAIETVGTTNNMITITLPGSGIVLKDDPLKITFLTLPVEQKDLVLILSFGSNYSLKRTLELKDASQRTTSNPDGWISVDARKKAYISNVAVPGGDLWTYTLDVTGNYTTSVPMAGGNVNYTVASYRTNSFTSEKQAVTWTTQYSVNGGEWTTTCPSWLEGFTETGPGSTSSPWEPDFATLPTNDTPMEWEGSTTPVATTQASARDLSCYDIHGNFTGGVEGVSPYNTANCYVVGAPGWYRIPCVYGNAIKNGVDNSASYTGVASGASLLTGHFLNHADAPITSPWIKDNASGTAAGSPSIVIDGASLVWQDHNGLITQVEYDSDYLYFYVDPSNIFQGNALIAAKAGSTIVWSWHIWVMDNPQTRLTTKLMYSHPTVNHSIVEPQTVLSMDLGFCDTSPGAVASRHVRVKFIQSGSGMERVITINQLGEVSYNVTYYQWGRKDPMPPGVINLQTTGTGASVDKTLYDINGATVSRPSAVLRTKTIGYSIENPFIFIYGGAVDNWTSRYDNLWNTNVTQAAADQHGDGSPALDQVVCKTIYDPCPPGFKLPNKNAFSGFSLTGFNIPANGAWSTAPNLTYSNSSIEDLDAFDTILGYNFYLDPTDHSKGTVFMPRTGSRDYGSGNIVGVGRYSDKTGATPLGQNYLCYLTFAKNYLFTHWTTCRLYGLPARPFGDD